MRVCAEPGCPELSDKPRCPAHRRQAEQARGTRQQRGYDRRHERHRAAWAPKVATGTVQCARCGKTINPGQAWHDDHTDDRSGYLGPSHANCNDSAGGKAAWG